MKRILSILFCLAITCYAISADVKIDKNNCTITKDGKTYKLYGKVKIVDSFEDIKVKIVDSFEDVDIRIVDSFEDIKIKIVSNFEGIKK